MVIRSNNLTFQAIHVTGWGTIPGAALPLEMWYLAVINDAVGSMERSCVVELVTERSYLGVPGSARTGQFAIPPSAASDFTSLEQTYSYNVPG